MYRVVRTHASAEDTRTSQHFWNLAVRNLDVTSETSTATVDYGDDIADMHTCSVVAFAGTDVTCNRSELMRISRCRQETASDNAAASARPLRRINITCSSVGDRRRRLRWKLPGTNWCRIMDDPVQWPVKRPGPNTLHYAYTSPAVVVTAVLRPPWPAL